jgi:hypothetical protein
MALAFKVATFTMKTLAKPLASRFQGWMLSHPYWRERCINLAQAIHRAEVRVTRGAEGKEGKAFVGKMTEEKALDLASKIVSEGFIYTFGAGQRLGAPTLPCFLVAQFSCLSSFFSVVLRSPNQGQFHYVLDYNCYVSNVFYHVFAEKQ